MMRNPYRRELTTSNIKRHIQSHRIKTPKEDVVNVYEKEKQSYLQLQSIVRIFLYPYAWSNMAIISLLVLKIITLE